MKLLDKIQRAYRDVVRVFRSRRDKPVILRYVLGGGRTLMPDTESYYLGVRYGGRTWRIKGTPRSFWDVSDVKRTLNSGHKHARFFVVNKAGSVVSTIDRKFMTTVAA